MVKVRGGFLKFSKNFNLALLAKQGWIGGCFKIRNHWWPELLNKNIIQVVLLLTRSWAIDRHMHVIVYEILRNSLRRVCYGRLGMGLQLKYVKIAGFQCLQLLKFNPR
jgi:hypothetical protein